VTPDFSSSFSGQVGFHLFTLKHQSLPRSRYRVGRKKVRANALARSAAPNSCRFSDATPP